MVLRFHIMTPFANLVTCIQAKEFVSNWKTAMGDVASKQEELRQFASVGVKVEAVNTQLKEHQASRKGDGDY